MKKLLLLFSTLFVSSNFFGADITWDGGGGDGLWNTAANWDGDVVPTSADNVFIVGDIGFPPPFSVTYYIGANASALSLTMSEGLLLDVYANLDVEGDIVLQDANSTLQISDYGAGFVGSLNVGGEISGSGSLNVIDGSETTTVEYDGTTAQTIYPAVYDNLIFSGSSTKTISSVITYNSFIFTGSQNVTFDTEDPLVVLVPDAGTYGTLTFTGTGEKSINSSLTVSTLVIDPTDQPAVKYSSSSSQTIINSTYYGLTLAGTGSKLIPETPTVLGAFNATDQDVEYSGSTAQEILSASYGDITLSGIGTKTIKDNLSYDNLIFSGSQDVTFDTDVSTTIPNAGTYGTLTLAGTGAKAISEDLTVTTLVIDPIDLPEVNYNGSAQQTVYDATYQNLTFSGTGLKVIPTTPTVNGTFSAGSVDVRYSGDNNATQLILPGTYNKLDLTGTDSKVISTLDVVVNSDFTANDATILITDGELNLNGVADFGTSTIEFGRDGDQDIPQYSDDYYNLSISGTGTKTIVDATSISAIKDFTIESGATFNLLSDSISICGNITNNGTFDQSGGTIVLACADPSTLSGNIEITNLTLIKTADVLVDVPGNLEIAAGGQLTLTSTNDDLSVTGSLVLKADAMDNYAVVNELPAENSITGSNITVQAYFAPTQRSWWHVSTPVVTPPATDWINSGVIITGDFTGNSNDDIEGTDLQSMLSFDETSTLSQDSSWADFPSANASETMESGRGYRIYIRDSKTTFSDKTVSLTGALNQGSETLPVTYTNTGDADSDGWNLVGNPYPAPLDWNLAQSSNASNLEFSSAYVWNANSKTYSTFGDNITIAPFQAFFVKAANGGSDISLTESMKSSTSVALQRTALETNIINISIEENDIDRPYNFASTQVKINPLATSNLDYDYDAGYLSRNMFNDAETPSLIDISTVTPNNRKLSVNTLPESTEEQTIPLSVEFTDFDEYTINVSLENYDYSNIILEDTYLNTIASLDANDEINYVVTTDDTEASKSSDRFVLKVGASPLAIDESNDLNSVLNVYPNPTTNSFNYKLNWSYNNVELQVSDLYGNVVLTKSINNNESSINGKISVENLESGVYNVSVTSGTNVVTQKLIIK